jgi:DNA-directed RNA polymerase specialized sigma24 family protein
MTDTRHTRAGGDQDETRRAQRGERSAFLHLYERHAPLTWRLALVAGRDRAAAEAAVVSAFAQVLARPDRRDAQRFAPIGAQLLRSARDAAVDQASRVSEPTGLEAISDTPDAESLCAFDRLPERWRSVLWLDQVEHCDFGTTALALGTSGPSTTALATRALGGFHEQLVQLKVHPSMKSDCRQTTLRLGAYVALALPSRDAVRVRRHLDRCEGCRTRLDDLDDVTTHLRGALPALPLAVESLAMGAWFARAHEGAGPLGLRLPGGALAPAWVERSLAGATAAVVSLGITAAVLLNARGGGNPVPTESAIARSEGEQALASEDPIDEGTTDGSPIVVDVPSSGSSSDASSSGSGGTSSGGWDASAGPASPTPSSGALPRGEGSSSPSSPSGPTPTGSTPTTTPTPPDPPGSSDDQSSTPVDEVIDVVDDVFGDVCGTLGPVCDAAPVEPSLPELGL